MRNENIDRAFAAGYAHGESRGICSPGEAEIALRELGLLEGIDPNMIYSEITAFCNGADDGAIGDRWRLDGCCKGAFERGFDR